jgi:hypothetical protein
MNVYEAIDLGGGFPRRVDAGKSTEPTRAELASNDPETARERILSENYGPRRTGLDFDRESFNREATRLDQEYASRVTAERAATERAAAQQTLDSLRQNGRGSSPGTAYKRFQR